MRQIPQCAVDLVKKFEGFRPNVYKCPAGIDTFGYGSLVQNYPTLKFPITKKIAEDCLTNDVLKSANAVTRLIKVPLNDNQYGALIDFVYNLGSGALQRSTLRSKLNRGDYKKAADEFLKWVYGGGIKLLGLVRRREAERQLFLNDSQ